MNIKVPNFFKYDIISNGNKVGEGIGPCKAVMKNTLKVCGVLSNVDIKNKGLNLKRK